MKRKAVSILVCILFLAAMAACTGPQPVIQYELGKVTAETILYDARIAMNQGKITPALFDQVRVVYDRLKQAQDIAIDARKAMIAYNTAESQGKAQAAMNEVLALSTRMLNLAQSIGITKGGN